MPESPKCPTSRYSQTPLPSKAASHQVPPSLDILAAERHEIGVPTGIEDHGAVVRAGQPALHSRVPRTAGRDQQRAGKGDAIIVRCEDRQLRR